MKYKENIVKWNLEKYNFNKEIYEKHLIQLFMENANTHLISTFKDFLFYDDFTEFFTKFYPIKKSLTILMHLLRYYDKSSYIFPNYTVIHEGKYIYKNIIKKQMLINYIEDLEIKKKKDIIIYKVNKNKSKFNPKKFFDVQLYNNLMDSNCNNSNINLIFGINNIKENNNKDNIENDSINNIKKLINIISESNTKSVGTNTVNISSYNNKKIKKGKKRNNLSPKGINNSTNFSSKISNTNITSMLRLDKKINISSHYFFNNKNTSITNNDNNSNKNSNYSTKINFKMNKKLNKINNKKKTNSFMSNFNSSFMKTFLKKISDKNINYLMKSKNKKLKSKKMQILTPIEKIKHHISLCSVMTKESKINKYLTSLPSLDNCPKINLKYKKIKIINNNSNNISSSHMKSKSKLDLKLNKGLLINRSLNHNYRYQRNKLLITDNNNLNNSKKSHFNISLNNITYKTTNTNIIKKTLLPMNQNNKNKKIYLADKMFKKDKKSKEKYYSNNISKKMIINKYLCKDKEDKKKNYKKIITSYFSTKLPSPINNKPKNKIKTGFGLYKSKNKSLINNFKMLRNYNFFKNKKLSK